MPQNYDPTMFGGTPGVPASDYTDGLENPDWTPTFTTDGAMTFDVERHGHAGLRTTGGLVDLMEDLVEEPAELVRRFLEGNLPHEEMPEWLRRVLPTNLPPPVDVRADINPARHFRTTTFAIQAGGAPTLISAMADRLRAVITNTGAANPCQISWTDNATNINTAGNMEWITLNKGVDPTNPRILLARGKIYAYSVLGTTLDIQEEYGELERRGSYVAPAGG